MEDDTKFFLGSAFLIVVIVILASWGEYVYNSWKCKGAYKDYNPTYSIINGCLLEVDGKQVPSANFRVI